MKNVSLIIAVLSVLVMWTSGCTRDNVAPVDEILELAAGEHVSVSSLPALVHSYIQRTYPEATIVKAEKKLNPDGSFRKYEIELSNGMELYFDEQGNVMQDDGGQSGTDDSIDISTSELPQTALDYLASHYPNQRIKRAKKKLNDDGTIRQYEVRLDNDMKVFFNPSGEFLGTN